MFSFREIRGCHFRRPMSVSSTFPYVVYRTKTDLFVKDWRIEEILRIFRKVCANRAA